MLPRIYASSLTSADPDTIGTTTSLPLISHLTCSFEISDVSFIIHFKLYFESFNDSFRLWL
jgi:hypothetical protein